MSIIQKGSRKKAMKKRNRKIRREKSTNEIDTEKDVTYKRLFFCSLGWNKRLKLSCLQFILQCGLAGVVEACKKKKVNLSTR